MPIRLMISIVSIFILTASCQTIDRDEGLTRGNEYAKDGLYREAMDSYKKAYKRNPKNPTLLRNMGMVYVKLGDNKNAIKSLEASMSMYDEDYEANYYLGEAYRSNDLYSQAIYRLQKALRLNPDSTKTKKALAWSYYSIRYYSEALKLAQELYQERKNDLQATVILARVYLKLNQFDKASAIIRLAKATMPAEALPYLDAVAGDIAQGQGNCKVATQYYQVALKAQPLMPLPLIGMGACLLSINQVDQGIKYLERAVKIQPKHAIAYLLLGQAYETKKDPKSGQFYRKFMAMAKDDPELLPKVSSLQQRLRTASK